MEGLILMCIGLIGLLFYRTHRQKKQLSSLKKQFDKLQQQIAQGQELQTNLVTERAADESMESLKRTYTQSRPKASAWGVEPKETDNVNPASKPTVIDQAISRATGLVINYFSQGNQIVRIGIIVLFFGMSFLAKYSIDNALVSIEVRMAGILISGIIMLGIGWHLRVKNPAYGLIMQGGGVAISYVAIFASFKLYHLIPSELTFPLLIVFSLLAMSLAVFQNSKALAITSISGGFAAPILASTGAGSHVSLFSYYLALNCAIFFVAWFKSWRMLNVIGFFFTFVVATYWGVIQYRPEHFSSTEPFLIAFFLIYVSISILFSIKQKPELKGYVDGTLVFGMPIVGFGLQSALVHHLDYGLAYSSAALAGFYFIVTYLLRKNTRSGKLGSENLQILSQAMLALALIFATLTIPFALDGRWSAASWAMEGAGFVWIALRQQREILKYVGLAIQIVGGLLFFADYPYRGDVIVFLNVEFMGISIITFAALFTAYLIQSEQGRLKNIGVTDEIDEQLSDTNQRVLSLNKRINSVASIGLIIWGLFWWYAGGLFQVEGHISHQYELTSLVAFFVASAGLWLTLSLKLRWKQFSFFPWLLLFPLCLYYWPTVFDSHFIANYGFISWSLGLTLLYGIFYKLECAELSLFKPIALHSISYLLVLGVVSYELAWLVDDYGLSTAWSACAMMLALILALHLINKSQRWPFKNNQQAYQSIATVVIIGLMLIWSLVSNFLTLLKPDPIPYLPIFNPVDLIQLLALWTSIKCYRLHGHKLVFFEKADSRWVLGLLVGFIFVWINVLLFKTIHLVEGVEYQLNALFESAIVQTCVSIVWTLIGLAVMVLASKRSLRSLWIIGASLTAIVVAKLFLLDLSGQGTVERIISFLVVGVLLLVVGYFSPVPPNVNEEESKAAMDTE